MGASPNSSKGTAEERGNVNEVQKNKGLKKKAAVRKDSGGRAKKTVSADSVSKGKPSSVVPVWATGTEFAGKHNFPGSAYHVSTFDAMYSLAC